VLAGIDHQNALLRAELGTDHDAPITLPDIDESDLQRTRCCDVLGADEIARSTPLDLAPAVGLRDDVEKVSPANVPNACVQ